MTTGFRFAPLEWSQERALDIARQENLALDKDHWELIHGLQEFYARHHAVAINMRELQDALEEKFHHKGGLKYLYTLLPGGPIAHGFLTLSLLPQFFQSAFEIVQSRMGVNYGLNNYWRFFQRVDRFPSPVKRL